MTNSTDAVPPASSTSGATISATCRSGRRQHADLYRLVVHPLVVVLKGVLKHAITEIGDDNDFVLVIDVQRKLDLFLSRVADPGSERALIVEGADPGPLAFAEPPQKQLIGPTAVPLRQSLDS